MIEELIKLRQTLHKHPELSGEEFETAKRVREFLTETKPSKILRNLGGTSFCAVYEFSKSGPVIGIRCELDALPIEEENDFDYKSIDKGTSHKCGHDGHMAIVTGLAYWIKDQKYSSGKLVLIFQSSEETGKGALEILSDPRFIELDLDYIFALHNIPGSPLHSIIVLPQGFSAEVLSMSIKLKGTESHASEPEKGTNPALAISDIIACLHRMNFSDASNRAFAILTPVFINLGQKSYGISPGFGEIHYTIRCWTSEQMKSLKTEIKGAVSEICLIKGIKFSIDWFEQFPAHENDSICNSYITQAAKMNDLKIQIASYPFKFGEDFGWFSRKYKTGMFGLGSGIDCPALHSNVYDFPDEIINTGVKMFASIVENILR